MRERSRIFGKILDEYSLEETQGDDSVEEAETGSDKNGKRVVFWILAHIIPLSLSAIGIVALVVVAGGMMALLQSFFGKSGDSKDYRPSYVNGVDYKSFFSGNSKDLPFGIPVERGIITMGLDDGKRLYGIGTYSKHTGIDMARVYGDKSSNYYPFIFSTHDSIVVHAEKRYEDETDPKYYVYERRVYIQGGYVTVNTRVRKEQAQGNIRVKPYGINVLLSTLDGRYYTLYAHLSSYKPDIVDLTRISRGEIIGTMGNTGNSFGAHLHYEIRYCGNDNADYSKTPRECALLNPLDTIPELGNNFLGIDPSKSRLVYAGSLDARMGAIAVNKTENGNETNIFKDEYSTFCSMASPLLLGKSVGCRDVFPIVYQKKRNPLYPEISSESERIVAAKRYLKDEYGVSGEVGLDRMTEIASMEGIRLSDISGERFLQDLGKTLSFGRYENKLGKVYKTREIFASDASTQNAEMDMLKGLIDSLEKLKKTTGGSEKAYGEYYGSAGYKSLHDNPYLYNMSSGENTFMHIRDDQGNPTGIYRDFGVMAIYNRVN